MSNHRPEEPSPEQPAAPAPHPRPGCLLVTGTDTGVGKTWVTALIVRQLLAEGHRTGVYKPACSGAETRPDGTSFWPDLEVLREATGGQWSLDEICPQRFQQPLAPPVAARLEGRTVDSQLLRSAARRWDGLVDLLVIEGVGGLLCPLTEEETVADLAASLEAPLLIVARAGLGTINHTLLTVEMAASRGLKVAGVLLNEEVPAEDPEAGESNLREIAARCTVPMLGVLPYGSSSGLLHRGQMDRINWSALIAGTLVESGRNTEDPQ